MKKKYFSLVLMLIFISAFSQNPIQTTLWDYQSEGFEGAFPPSDWQAFHCCGATTDWEHSTTIGGFQSSSSSVFFDNTVATGFVQVLRTPSFDFTTAIKPTLTFDVAYARYDNSNSDRLLVYYTTNTSGTSGWDEVVLDFGVDLIDPADDVLADYIGNDLATAPNQTTPFTPDEASDWKTFTLPLDIYAGESYIRFAFEARPDQPNGTTNNMIYIDNVNFFDASPLAVNNESLVDFSVYPNPTEGRVSINTSLENLNKENFKIRNLLGQEYKNFSISKNSNTSYQLNLENFSSGMYFITVSSDEKSTTKKLYIK
jgi:hypothetical protein|tara:strand:+ start:458 stop:1399 length:942 start_codon:yes stop_codon:yes gene_type:complete